MLTDATQTMIAVNIHSILDTSILYKIVSLFFSQKVDLFSSQGRTGCIHLSEKHDLIFQSISGKECGNLFDFFLSLNNCKGKKIEMH